MTWYAYDPEDGIGLYGTAEEARAAAEAAIEAHRDLAAGAEWHPDVESVAWGRLVPYERATETDRRPLLVYEELDVPARVDHTCDYVLAPVEAEPVEAEGLDQDASV
ncbi:MAG: hypothetical protein ACOCZU_01125 [Planctomycetota bacterium]